MVAASRVYHNKHWMSDVFLGAVIGYGVGGYVVGFENKEKTRLFGHKIEPWFRLSTVGLRVYLN